MIAKFLERGNIIELKKEMRVNFQLEERFIESTKPFSTKIVWGSVKIGEILTVENLTENDRKYFKNDISDVLGRLGIKMPVKELDSIIIQIFYKYEDSLKDTFDTSVLAGKYVVMHTGLDDEGRSQKGYRVIAKKLSKGIYDPNGIEVAFYQDPGYMSSIMPDEIRAIDDLLKFN